MEPKQYSTLLFDDDNFTRSRKYFWAIGCLNEFIISIADNIKQWDMYHAARNDRILELPEIVARLDAASVLPPAPIGAEYGIRTGEQELEYMKRMVIKGSNRREDLVNLKTQFENKLETVKSLRDGVRQLPIIFQTFEMSVYANFVYSFLTQALLWRVEHQLALERTSNF
jgi:hypothetical protein